MKTILSALLMMWAMSIATAVAAATAAATRPDGNPKSKFLPNPKLTAIAENTWQKVAGPPPAPKGIMAYSGGAYDSVNHRLLILGGGHSDYSGNEICAFDPVTLTWKKLYEPDDPKRYTTENVDPIKGQIKDGDKPCTRHTYNQICFAAKENALFIFSGPGPGFQGMKIFVSHDTWSYSCKDEKWALLYSGADNPHGEDQACCYDAKRDVVWAYTAYVLHRFDFTANAWTHRDVLKGQDVPGNYFRLEYLPKCDRLLMVPHAGGASYTINPEDAKAQTQPMPAKFACRGGPAYLPEQDVAFAADIDEQGNCGYAVFDAATLQWRTWKTSNNPDGARGSPSIYGRLRYDPVDRVILLAAPGGVWAYQPPKTFSTPASQP